MGIVLGIDLGTTNSCMARVDPATGQARVLLNREGERTTPSVVAFDASGRVTVGSAARRQAALHPRDTIFGAKRLVGRRFADPAVQAMRKLLPYEVAADAAGNAAVRVHGQLKSPSEVLSHVLRYLKESAENNLGQPVDGAVITVPAYFDEVQRQETKLAGERAGLTVHRLLNEPTAAMLACRVDESRAENIAVFDLGGGTFDISLLHVEGEVVQVLATCGDNQLGGDNIDELLVDALRRIFLKQTGQDLGTHPEALWRLKEASESTKRVLSEREQTALDLPYLTTTSGGEPLHLSLPSFSRTLLENLSQRELERLRGPCEQAMRDAGLALADIHRVVLVGGMTRMPAVRARAERYLGRPGERSVNPDEAVALGAALEADIVAGDSPAAPQVLLLDVLSRSLGIRTEGGRFSVLIPRNTTIPTRETKVFTTTADQQTHVDLEVYQGESPLVEGNRYLGELRLTELTPAAAGAVRVAVDFTIDADGILQVTAREPATGRKAQATLRPPPPPPPERAPAMSQDAPPDQTPPPNPFTVLGLQGTEDLPAIRKAFLRIAAHSHPDRLRAKSPEEKAQALEVFLVAKKAFETLSQPDKRREWSEKMAPSKLRPSLPVRPGSAPTPAWGVPVYVPSPRPPPDTAAQQLYKLGMLALEAQDYGKALGMFSRAARLLPTPRYQAMELVCRGHQYLSTRFFDRARESFEQALQLHPECREAQVSLELVDKQSGRYLKGR